MGKTNISIENESFLINGKLTYSEINTSKPQAHGLLMNARFIQGIFLSLSATQHGWIQISQIVHHSDGYDYELGEAFASA